MRLGVLTCGEYPQGIEDDRELRSALEARGVEWVPWVWDRPRPEGLAATLIRSPWDYYQRAQKFEGWLERATGLVLNPVKLLKWNWRKGYLLELERGGVPIVPTRVLGASETAEGFWRSLPWRAWVVKPDLAAGAHLTERGEGAKAPEALIDAIRASGAAVVVQPFCSEVAERGEVSLIYFRGPRGPHHFSHSVIKRPAGGDFRVQEKHGGASQPWVPTDEAKAVAEKVLAQVPHPWAYARVDLMPFEGRWVLGELEVFEPELFFRHGGERAVGLAAQCLLEFLQG